MLVIAQLLFLALLIIIFPVVAIAITAPVWVPMYLFYLYSQREE